MSQKPIVVLGLPRSGTTWTAQILACSPATVSVMEPDNEKTSVPAIAAKASVGRFPVLAVGDEAGRYRDLWAWALAGGPPGVGQRLGRRLAASAGPAEFEALVSGRSSLRLRLAGRLAQPLPSAGRGERQGDVRVVAKSVHAPLAAEWLAATFDIDVLVVLRHPANVLASWLELDLPDRDRRLDDEDVVRRLYLDRWDIPAPPATVLDRAVWQLGLLTAALEDAAARHLEWRVRVHEELCADPDAEFRRLYGDLGLDWSERTSEELERGNRPGAGFAVQRRAADEVDRWRTRLGPAEKAALQRGLAPFPLQHWSTDDIAGDVCAG